VELAKRTQSDYVDAPRDQFCKYCWGSFEIALRGPPLDDDVAAFDPAEIAQTMHEGSRDRLNRIGARHLGQGYDGKDKGNDRLPPPGLLRARNRRPCRRHPAEKRNEVAPPHESPENTL